MKPFKIILVLTTLFLIACKKEAAKPTEPNYTNFKILNVKLSAMPFLDASNTSWDPFDGPDVFFNMESSNGTVLFNGTDSRFKDIAQADIPLSWNFVNAYQITNLSVTHFVTIYDYDTLDPNDLIGSIGFTLNDNKSGYPKEITKSLGSLTVKITGEWY